MKNPLKTNQPESPGNEWINYIRIPREIAKDMFNPNSFKRGIARLYLALIMESYFIDGNKLIAGQAYFCRAGECLTSCRKLAELIEMSPATVQRLLKKLEERKEIEVIHCGEVSRIRLKRYKEWNEAYYRNRNYRESARVLHTGLPDLASPAPEEIRRMEQKRREREARRKTDRNQ